MDTGCETKFCLAYAEVICSHFFMLREIFKCYQLSDETKAMIRCYLTALSLVVYLPHLGFL